MKKSIDPKSYLAALGKAMDWDAEHDVYGQPGTETIPWLHKKPESYSDIFLAMQTYLRDCGVTITFEYDHEEVDIDRMLKASEIRGKCDE